jgi:hypothetical protein
MVDLNNNFFNNGNFGNRINVRNEEDANKSEYFASNAPEQHNDRGLRPVIGHNGAASPWLPVNFGYSYETLVRRNGLIGLVPRNLKMLRNYSPHGLGRHVILFETHVIAEVMQYRVRKTSYINNHRVFCCNNEDGLWGISCMLSIQFHDEGCELRMLIENRIVPRIWTNNFEACNIMQRVLLDELNNQLLQELLLLDFAHDPLILEYAILH